MQRYIDAEKLKRKLIEGDGHDDDRFTEGYNFAINEIRGYINNILTADVEPVQHRKWIIIDDVEHFLAKCSVCGRTEDSRRINEYPYCHCGAKMNGGDE